MKWGQWGYPVFRHVSDEAMWGTAGWFREKCSWNGGCGVVEIAHLKPNILLIRIWNCFRWGLFELSMVGVCVCDNIRVGPWGIEDNIQMLGFYGEEKPYIDLAPWLGLKRNVKGKSWQILESHHVWMVKNTQRFKWKQLLNTAFDIWCIWIKDLGPNIAPTPGCWSTEHVSPNAGADGSEGIRPDFPKSSSKRRWGVSSDCTLKSSILIGFDRINHPCGGTPISGNPGMGISAYYTKIWCMNTHLPILPRFPRRLALKNTEGLAKTAPGSWVRLGRTISLHMPTTRPLSWWVSSRTSKYISPVKASNYWYLWCLNPIHWLIETC